MSDGDLLAKFTDNCGGGSPAVTELSRMVVSLGEQGDLSELLSLVNPTSALLEAS